MTVSDYRSSFPNRKICNATILHALPINFGFVDLQNPLTLKVLAKGPDMELRKLIDCRQKLLKDHPSDLSVLPEFDLAKLLAHPSLVSLVFNVEGCFDSQYISVFMVDRVTIPGYIKSVGDLGLNGKTFLSGLPLQVKILDPSPGHVKILAPAHVVKILAPAPAPVVSPVPVLLAPPISVGLLSPWVSHKYQNAGVRFIKFSSGGGSSVRVPVLYFFGVDFYDANDRTKQRAYMPICDALASGILQKVDPNVKLYALHVTAGFVDMDDVDTLKNLRNITPDSTPTGIRAKKKLMSRISWLRRLHRSGLVRRANNDSTPPVEGSNLASFGQETSMFGVGMRITGYIGSKIATFWTYNPDRTRYAPVLLGSGGIKPPDCSLLRSPREHLLRHGSVLALGTLVGSALVGAGASRLWTRKSRKTQKRTDFALKQLALFRDTTGNLKSGQTGKRLALEASHLLVPAAVVDEGSGAVVRWITSRRPSWWKRYAPAVLAVVAVALLGSDDGARMVAAHASVALAVGATATADVTDHLRSHSRSATGIARRSKVYKDKSLSRQDSIILTLLGENMAWLQDLQPEDFRRVVLKAMPRTLELLFTDPDTGATFPNRLVLDRIVLHPTLLRPQLYMTPKGRRHNKHGELPTKK